MKKKQSKGRQKRRMTELDIRMVVEEIEAWRNDDRGSKLTWAKLERIFPFTRQTMHSKEGIRKAYENAQRPLKIGKIGQNRSNFEHLSYIEIESLKKRIKELEEQIEEWQKLWLELSL